MGRNERTRSSLAATAGGHPAPRGFNRLSDSAARIVLVCFAGAAAWLIWLTLSSWREGYAESPRFAHIKHNDSDLYHAEVDRIQRGEGYYEAAGSELAMRGYPTKSLFNWRTPLPVWLIGQLPDKIWGKLILAAAAVLLCMLGLEVAAREFGTLWGTVCGAWLFGAVVFCFLGESYVMPILWASVLVGLSLCAYARGWPLCAVALGVGAVYFRDLAGFYGVVALALDAAERRWKCCLAWLAGLGSYFLFFFCLHARWVDAHMPAVPLAHEEGWMRFGGAPFLLALTQVHAYLIVWPQWVSALYLAAALLGLAHWDSQAGRRFTAVTVGYLVLFACVGQKFNQYWGALIAPPLCFGAANAPRALAALVQRGCAGWQIPGSHSEPKAAPR